MKALLILAIALCSFSSVSTDCATCGTDENCNITSNTCVCNSTSYNYTVSNPSPTVNCDGGIMSLFVSKCWLENNGYNSSNITLNNSTCVAEREIVNGTAYMTLHKPLSTYVCGNTVTMNTSYVTYSNTLQIFAKKEILVTQNDVAMNFFCSYPLNMTVQLNVTLKPIIGSTTIENPLTNAVLTVNMVAYKEISFSTLLSSNDPLYVEDTVYIAVTIPNLDIDTFKLQVININASASEAGPTYSLLDNGCPSTGITANLMSVLSNGNSTESRFAMKVFQISGSSNVILTAEVKLCIKDCEFTCNNKDKIATAQDNTAIVSVSLNADDRYLYDSATCLSMSWIMSSIILSLLLVKLI